ncbi:positive control factor [Robertmurraya siralis]|uniref:Positive control factor n=1 Tax=Robertmurraya siralis TaxID=77777 RepID=A0A919WI41_9BACI|nr:sigma factor-like helix-turn-helix DNA-binding protein [Robertmurraya siralis]GIN62365.1 positive control factor [Robertmurraya siralis]
MQNWTDKLIQEYAEGKRQLNKLHKKLNSEVPEESEKRKIVSGMIEDMDFVIEWLETGRQPGIMRGVDKRSIYQKHSLESMDIIPDIAEQLTANDKPLSIPAEQKKVLIEILSSFSLRERQCYILHVAQGLSMQEIAEEIGLKKRTVQQYIDRAKKKVEQMVP